MRDGAVEEVERDTEGELARGEGAGVGQEELTGSESLSGQLSPRKRSVGVKKTYRLNCL